MCNSAQDYVYLVDMSVLLSGKYLWNENSLKAYQGKHIIN